MVDSLILPPGIRSDARVGILVLAILGEVLQGGLFFGWSALSIMITDEGNYEEGCDEAGEGIDGDTICKSQESKLALLWTVGIFALNFGPVLMGFVLDYLGPKFTAILGVSLNMLGLILFGASSSNGFNGFIAAAIILGLGNITFHLAQFHISSLFPTKRGLVTSIFVAGFTGSGIMMYVLQLIYEAAGSTRAAYTWVLIGYSFICGLWAPLLWWMMPNESFKVGEIYLLRNDWKFEKRLRADLGRTYRRTTAMQDYVVAANAARERDSQIQQANNISASSQERLVEGNKTSSDPMWAEDEDRRVHFEEEAEEVRVNATESVVDKDAGSSNQTGESSSHPEIQGDQIPRRLEDAPIGHESMPLPPDVSFGPLIFESRRFVELRKKTFKEQFMSTESFGMGIFYTLNVFFQQFYLGTQRLQLESKGDTNHAYAEFGNIIVAFAAFAIPLIAWLLDKKGYGITLGAINALSIITGAFQALPMLWVQAFTLVFWMIGRFFMYSSYFAIFGALFGFRNFGKLVAIDNSFNGLFGLLQFPLTYFAIHVLDGNFTVINIAQVIIILPLSIFCYYMYKWEREDLVPIRPLEGEELPCDMLGYREKKKLPEVHLPHIELPNFLHGRQSRDAEPML